MFTLELEGHREAVQAIEEVVAAHEHAHRAASFLVMQRMLEQVLPNVPVKSGALYDSAYLLRTWPIVAGFGERHAQLVHEGIGRGAKFLQRPFFREAGEFESRVARKMRRALQLGLTLNSVHSPFPDFVPAQRGRRQRLTPPSRS